MKDKPLKTVEEEIVNYRIWCDYAVQEKEQGLIDQKEYERAIQWHLAEAVKQLNNHYYQLILSLVGDMEYRETLDMGLSSWTGEDYKAFGRNELRNDIRAKLSEHFNGEGEV